MISKSEWQDAYREHLEEGRKRLGPPPTAEEVEALLAGNLAGAEAERVRELLAYYPEVAKMMTAEFPADSAGVLTEAELAEDRAKLLARVRRPIGDPVSIRRPVRRILATAAVLAIAVAGAAIVYEMNDFNGVPVMLSADGQLAAPTRGSGQTPHQLHTETDYLLKPTFRPERDYRSYRVELVDLAGEPARSIETWRRVNWAPAGSFPVELSTKGFAEGRYQLVLYGVTEQPERLATYTIRLTAP